MRNQLVSILWGVALGVLGAVSGAVIGFGLFGLLLFANTNQATFLIGASALIGFAISFFLRYRRAVRENSLNATRPLAIIALEVALGAIFLYWLNVRNEDLNEVRNEKVSAEAGFCQRFSDIQRITNASYSFPADKSGYRITFTSKGSISGMYELDASLVGRSVSSSPVWQKKSTFHLPSGSATNDIFIPYADIIRGYRSFLGRQDARIAEQSDFTAYLTLTLLETEEERNRDLLTGNFVCPGFIERSDMISSSEDIPVPVRFTLEAGSFTAYSPEEKIY
jgi:hypothetical protein